MICFNGAGDESYETFHVARVPTGRSPRWPDEQGCFFGFCKTQYRPYDKVVVAALCLLDTVTGGQFDPSSDGDPEEWQEGLELAQKVLSSARIPPGVLERE